MRPLDILVVDDQPVNLRLLTAQLEAEGHRVFQASQGEEALAVLETSAAIDLIISDILMPVMDGYRLCGEVRRSKRHRHIPFIFYTATYTSPADERLCLQIGGDRYLRKPVPVPELLAAIESVLASVRHQPALTDEAQDILKEYSERLVFKLEQKNIELSSASDQLALQAKALDAAPDAILITDSHGTISWVNRAFLDLTGQPPDVLGMMTSELDAGLDGPVFDESFWRDRDEPVWRGGTEIRRKDGAIRHVEQSINAVRAANGGITHFVSVIHDITDRKRAEEALREAHMQLHELLNHTPAVLYALKVEGETLVPRFVSENILRLLGFSVAESLSMEWWRAQLHPEDRAIAEAGMEETLTRGVSRTEYRVRHKDGTVRWVEDNRRLTLDDSGRPDEMVGVWTDTTERRAAQEEKRESEHRFREMLDNLELVSIMLDGQGRVTYCNDYFLRLTGWRREEVIGRNWFQLFIPSDDIDRMTGVFAQLMSDLPDARHHTNEILTRSGERRTLQWNNSLLRSTNGEVIGIASIAEDITERRSLEKQMMRAQRVESLGTLAGGIAHDMNNLLMPILMGVGLLRRIHPGENVRKVIDNIERSVRRGSDLVKQVLLFARGTDTSRAIVHLGPLLTEIVAIVSSTFPKDITLEIAIPDDLSPVTGDSTQLTQVLLNLCVNARDAMPDGGYLSVSCRNAVISSHEARIHGANDGGSYVVVQVADTGEGMPAEVVERIFDPFFTTKEVGKGTGLGLSTVQGIVTSHGGFVSVTSAPGGGSTFFVHLPASSDDAAIPSANPDRVRPPQGSDELILVVDDDTSILEITGQTLEAFGYRTITAGDGAQAIATFVRRQSEIALVLTDMAMPIVDGPALVAALLRMDPHLRIIGATGDRSASIMAKIEKLGVTHLLAKPYTADLLLRTIARVLAEDRPS